MATIFRTPILTRYERARGAAQAMTAQPEVTANRLLNLLKSQDLFFSGPGAGPDYDWTDPLRPPPPIVLRSWADPVKLTLIGQDKFFGVAGEAPAARDWTVPAQPRRLSEAGLANLLETTLGIAAPAPFRLRDWPNPIGAALLPELRSWLQNLLDSTLGAPALAPFRPLDWALPRRAGESQAGFVLLSNPQLIPPAAPSPAPAPETAMGGWTAGRRKRRRSAYDFLGCVPTADEIRAERHARGIGDGPPDDRSRAPDFETGTFADLIARLDALAGSDEAYARAKRVALDPALGERVEAAEAMLIALILASLD